MNTGFVTYINSNKKYLDLSNIMIESVLKFTDLKIEVNAINFDYSHDSNRVISKRINTPNESFNIICFSKILACIQSEFDYGLQLDADCIVTPEIVKVFNQENYTNINGYVLAPKHPQYPTHSEHLIKYFNAPQTQPYVHASTFLFNASSKNFLIETYNNCHNALNNGIFLPAQDESILNVTLWKHKVIDKYLDYIDPYYEIFLNRQTEKQFYDKEVKYYICHGCKDPSLAKSILNQIK